MSLGSLFPAEFARTQVERQLQPGVVVKFMATMDDGKTKEKRFVILDINQNSFTCVINSEINQFTLKSPDKLKCQVLIDAHDHPFMSWDSHIDCSRIRIYTKTELIDQLCKKPEWILGTVAPELREQIAATVKASKTISVALARQCCTALLAVK